MKKITTKPKNKREGDLLPHYDLDYRKGGRTLMLSSSKVLLYRCLSMKM